MPNLQKYAMDYDIEGGVSYRAYFLAPKDHYKDAIGTACGVSEIVPDTEGDMPITKIEELILSPVASRRVLRVTDSAGKNKYVDIIVASGKLATADNELTGKPFKTFGNITRVMDSRKAVKY